MLKSHFLYFLLIFPYIPHRVTYYIKMTTTNKLVYILLDKFVRVLLTANFNTKKKYVTLHISTK